MDLILEQGDLQEAALLEQAKNEGYLHGYESGYREGLVIGYPEGYKIGRELGIMHRNLLNSNEGLRGKGERLLADILAFPRDNAEGIDRQHELQRLRAVYRELASTGALPPLENVPTNKFDF